MHMALSPYLYKYRLPQGVDISEFNFDHPDALDFDLCYQVLLQLMNRQPAKIPNYDFKTSQRTDVWDEVQPADLILLEGIHAFYDEVRWMMRIYLELKRYIY